MVAIKKNLCPTDRYNIKCPYSMKPTRIIIHNTANDAPACNEIAYMLRNSEEVSFHYAVDDKEIVQGIPENRNAWHSGDDRGKGNMEGIGIEICYSSSGGSRFTKAENNAAEFAASILKRYGWSIDKLTKHQDYNGKYCPHRTLDNGWDKFVSKVKGYMGTKETSQPINTSSRVFAAGKNEITQSCGNGHTGVDVINTKPSNDLVAHSAGKVVLCQTGVPNDKGSSGMRSYGNCIKIKHNNGYYTLYAHLESVAVKNGSMVEQGQKIGVMGDTGNSYGRHLHFEVRNMSDEIINPEKYLNSSLPYNNSNSEKDITPTIWTEKNKKGQIVKFAVKVSCGNVWCQAHLLRGGWLPKITGFNPNEPENGYAGNGEVIDAIRIYYTTPNGELYKQARYSVNGLPKQVDDSTDNGMDGYAGNFGQAITSIILKISSK